MNPFEFQAALFKTWLDTATSLMSVAASAWSPAGAPGRSVTSTASPWWMPPAVPQASFAPFGLAPFGQAAAWPNPWTAWLAMATPQRQPANPMMDWMQLWMPAAPLAAMPFATMPFATMWTQAFQPSATPQASWHDPFSAYRSASGYATAVVRMMTPQPSSTQLSLPLWPMLAPFGTRLH